MNEVKANAGTAKVINLGSSKELQTANKKITNVGRAGQLNTQIIQSEKILAL